MNRGLGYEPRKDPVCRNFAKISLSHFFVPTTTTSLYYLASACLSLPQGSPSQPYPAKVSALSLSLPTSSFPAHSASTTDIPLTVCLQYPFFLRICVALLLSGLNFSFCLAPCSLALFLWLSFSSSLFWPLQVILPGPASCPLHASWPLLLLPGPPLWFSLPRLL